MHAEAYQFVQSALEGVRVKGRRILDIGALNVNGSVRPLFAGCAEYVGVDQVAGPDVDVVADAAHYDGAERFNVAVSCEALEHAIDPADIIDCAARALKPGGLLILTAAGEGRAPHDCNGGPPSGTEPYQNITRAALKRLLSDWADVQIHTSGTDIYATATKPATEDSSHGNNPSRSQ